MAAVEKRQGFTRRRDTSELLSAYIDQINERQRRSSVISRKSSHSSIVYRRSRSNPVISDSPLAVGRLERRRSAVTFPSTYRSLSTASSSCRSRTSQTSVSSLTQSGLWCHCNKKRSGPKTPEWSVLSNYFRQPKDEKKLTVNHIRIRKSLEKAIQKAGYSMNELVHATTGGLSPAVQRRESSILDKVDWTDNAIPDHHIWSPSSASGDLCYVGDENCQKSGSRKRCNACHIVVHDQCFDQFNQIGFPCKTTFRESTTKSMRESLVVHHHWVHRRKLDGKCKQCGKTFDKKFGFREHTKIIAISCSWCKEAYHNKVNCFQLQKINEPCSLGCLGKSIVPSTWIIKPQKQRSLRSRSRKRRSSSGVFRKRSSKEKKQRTFIVRPLSQHAAFVSPTLVFINPKSGGRQGAKLLQSFQLLLNPRQVFDLSEGGPREPLELYRRVPNLRILACGGDGTVGWVLSVLDSLNLTNPPPVAVLPLGTGNDLSRTLNFGHGYTDEPLHKIIQGVEEARIVKLDRWKLTVEGNENASRINEEEELDPPMEHDISSDAAGVNRLPLDVFNNYFSIGSDAHVALSFHESREAHPDKFTSRFGNLMFYARASMGEYLNRQMKNLSKNITVVCDGVDLTPRIRELKPVCILFLNIPRYSSGQLPWGNPPGNEFRVQRHDDRLMEVLAFSLNQLGMLFVGGHGERLMQCRSAVIRTNKPFPVQIDGEPCKLNPSNITIEFFNQANMLSKTKRKNSYGNDVQHEQIKIRVNTIQSDHYDAFKGAKDSLCVNATPLLVTVVMNQSTLDTVRSCLVLIMNEGERTSSSVTEKWIFLDASNPDKFYKIDKAREGDLVVADVITRDREVYILNFPEDSHSVKSFVERLRKYFTAKSRKLEAIDMKSKGQFPGGVTCGRSLHDAEDEVRFFAAEGSRDYADSSSAFLDVVFEQPELPEKLESANVNDLPGNKSLERGGVGEKESMSIMLKTTEHGALTAPSLSHLKAEALSDTESSHSSSSNEYILTDDSTFHSPSKHKKIPLTNSASTALGIDSSLPAVFSSQLSLDGTTQKKTKTHKRSKTDTDTLASGFHLSPSQIVNSMLLNKNQSNNAQDERHEDTTQCNGNENQRLLHLNGGVLNDESLKNENAAYWNKVYLDACKRGELDLMKLAFANGADRYLHDDEGYTALHHAVRFSYDRVFDWLLETGSLDFFDSLCRDREQSALHKAAWYGRFDMCRKLLEAGASSTIIDYKDMKPVDRAKQSDVAGLVELFIKYQNAKEAKPFETHL